MARLNLFSFSQHLRKIWIKTPILKKSYLRVGCSIISVSVAGSFYRKHALADVILEEVVEPDTLKEVYVINDRRHKSLVRKLERLLRWLQKSIENFMTLVSRSIYLLLAFSPATLSSPLLLIAGDEFKRWWWSILRDCVRRSGPCSTKFAQWIATRPDLFPLTLCKNLEDLQSRAYSHKWSSTEEALILAFGENWTDSLKIDRDETIEGPFAPVVLGSGCVAQVVLGKIGERQVAVKIIHPGESYQIFAFLYCLSVWCLDKFLCAEKLENFFFPN